MKNFNPGKFNIRIVFIKRVTGRDKYGDPFDNWVTFKSAWANKFDLMGTDFYASQATDTKVEIKFSCRYLKGVTKDMRIQCGTEVYEIAGVPIDIDNKHRELLIYGRLVKE